VDSPPGLLDTLIFSRSMVCKAAAEPDVSMIENNIHNRQCTYNNKACWRGTFELVYDTLSESRFA